MAHYRSRATLLGLPLFQLTIGPPPGGDSGSRGIARAWVAVGDIAFGALLAVGGVSVGAVSVGGLALGLLPIAGLALGVWAWGGGAVGVLAFGGAAFGAHAALGGLAVAGTYARGGAAHALHANDAQAALYFESSLFFQASEFVAASAHWWPLFALVVPLLQWLGRRREA
jgi:hypothetical protein